MERKSVEESLYRIASLQQGYFTSQQAKKAGYSDSRFAHHIKTGKWTREGRGIYRLTHYPMGDRPDLVYWSLWSRNREGQVLGVFSHQTALAIHDLSDAMPSQYHLTVPKRFRRYHEPPENLVLHFADLHANELWELDGYKVTSPLRTLMDVLLDEGISDELVIQAVSDGLNRGMVTRVEFRKLVDQLRSDRTDRILNVLDSHA